MSIIETLSNLIEFVVIKEDDKGAAMQISTVLWDVYYVACRRVLSKRTF